MVTILAVGLGFFSVFNNSGIWKINSLANLTSKIFSFWKNCLLKPPKDKGNLETMNKLLKVLSNPYSDQENINEFQKPATIGNKKYQTFCGT